MPATEQQDASLSELVVREAIERGMESPLRETIVETVQESEGGASAGRRLPIAGALVGVGAAIGYLLGTRGEDLSSADVSLESVETDEVVEEVTSQAESLTGEEEEESTAESSGGRLRRIVLVLGVAAGIALARRRLSSEATEEWEPIEEFETVGTDESDEQETDEEASAEEGAEAGMGGEADQEEAVDAEMADEDEE